jgi:GNAT superfamily N-acetyltransferase
MIETARMIADAYRWQRRLGHTSVPAPFCHIVANPALPDVWDANHADAVSAQTEAEIDSVLAAMEDHLAHTRWRVAHTDGFTPDVFLARLAHEDYQERPVTIQMALRGPLTDRGAVIDLRPVSSDADWGELHKLVALDFAEGRKTGDLDLSSDFVASAIAAHRSKGSAFSFHMAILDGDVVAYGAHALAPNGVGMIEDLFTLPSARRKGVATSMIAAFADRLHDSGSHTIFLGALASEAPKRLYGRLGFRPVGLARTWVKDASK